MKNQQGLHGAKRLLTTQAGLTVLFSLLGFFLYGKKVAISFLCGGVASILPSAYFANTLFAVHGAKYARQIVSRFYKGEAIKIALSVAIFALIFKYVDVSPLIFFMAYMIMQMAIWFAPFIFRNKQNRPERT